jgi:membrane-associated protease RseP (regulator of RpoE activity)
MFDRDQEPHLRQPAPYEQRFYPLLAGELYPARPVVAAALAALSLGSTLWLCPGRWFFDPFELDMWGYASAFVALLALHELGHAAAARVHGMALAPPFFIPVPGLGTLGGLLRARAPFKTWRSVFDVAVAGPLVGFVTSAGVLFAGLRAASFVPIGIGAGQRLTGSLIARVLGTWAAPPLPGGFEYQTDRFVYAGHVGLALTFLHLLPGGPFDGALLARAIAGRRRTWLSGFAALAIAAVAAVSRDPWWLVWSGVCVLPARRMPPPLNPYLRLGGLRWGLAVLALALAVMCAASPRVLFSGW